MNGQDDAGLVTLVRDRLAREPGALTAHRVAAALREAGRPVGDATVLAVHEQLRRDVVGAGPLEPLLRTPGTTDVLVNGCKEVWIDRGDGLERTGVTFTDEDSVRRLDSLSGWWPVRDGGWMMQPPARTYGWLTAPAVTRFSHRSPDLARCCRCGCRKPVP